MYNLRPIELTDLANDLKEYELQIGACATCSETFGSVINCLIVPKAAVEYIDWDRLELYHKQSDYCPHLIMDFYYENMILAYRLTTVNDRIVTSFFGPSPSVAINPIAILKWGQDVMYDLRTFTICPNSERYLAIEKLYHDHGLFCGLFCK